MNNKRTVFITGVTGLVGSYILKKYLENGHRVLCLARSKGEVSAETRVQRALNFWAEDKELFNSKNILVLEGDITKDRLGLNREQLELLASETEEIVHAAALTDLEGDVNVIQNVNVGGTQNLLEIGYEFYKKRKLFKINYISTIYVCGDYDGVFTEDDFDVGQDITIPYEKSKFNAEMMVRSYRRKGLWIDIFRLPAVVGESTTGKMLSFNQSFYQALRILNLGIFECLPCKEINLNIVFVDEMSESIYRVTSGSLNKNCCYNIFNAHSLPVENILLLACDFFNIKYPKFVYFNDFYDSITPAQSLLLKYNYAYISRKTKFDSRRTNEDLRMLGFEFSNDNQKHLINLFSYAEKRRFLKKVKK